MLKAPVANANVEENIMVWDSRKSEEELKALINVAPKSLKHAEEFCNSIDEALRENPDWEKLFPKYQLSRELR